MSGPYLSCWALAAVTRAVEAFNNDSPQRGEKEKNDGDSTH